MIGLMEPEIYTKMLKKLSEKVRAKFAVTTHGYSMVQFARLNDGSFFKCKQARQKADHCSQKKRKGEKGTAKKKIQKSKSL